MALVYVQEKKFKLNFSDDTGCVIIDGTAPEEPKLSMLLSNLISSDYKITTNNVTNAIKKINLDSKGFYAKTYGD